MYYIKGSSGDEMKISYYVQELQRVIKDESGPYGVVKVIRSRRNMQGEMEIYMQNIHHFAIAL